MITDNLAAMVWVAAGLMLGGTLGAHFLRRRRQIRVVCETFFLAGCYLLFLGLIDLGWRLVLS